MSSIPRFALYGTDQASQAWAETINLERIPERSSLFDWEIDLHVHEALVQVLYITAGGGEAFIDGRRHALVPPCLIVVPAGSVHGFSFRRDVDGPVVTAAQRPLEAVLSALAPELLSAVRRAAVLPVDRGSRPSEAIGPLFEVLAREARTTGIGQVAAGLSLLAAVFVQVARLGESLAFDCGDPRSRKARQVERFKTLVDLRFRERWPVQRYAKEIGISAGQLGRLTREILGCSPLDAVNARVIHEAQRELVYSSLSIKQIAAALGFDDDAYFGRFFRKHTGQRPTEFRKAGRARLAAAAR